MKRVMLPKTISSILVLLTFFCGPHGEVRAGSLDNFPESLMENQKQNKLPPDAYILPPHNFHVFSGGLREAVLIWSPPFDQAFQFIIQRSHSIDGTFKEIERISPKKGKHIDRGDFSSPLLDGQAYFYRMIAVSAQGHLSLPTPVKESRTAPAPSAPIHLEAKAPLAREIFLTWEMPHAEDIKNYIVQRKPADHPDPYQSIAKVEISAYFRDGGGKDSDLLDSTDYLYRVLAVNQVGAKGPPSHPVLIQTLPKPSPLDSLSATSNQLRAVQLEWETSPEPDVDGYLIYRKNSPEDMFKKIATIEGRGTIRHLDGKKIPGNLDDGHTYYYQIHSRNITGATSHPSEIVAATTRPPPPSVVGLSARSGQFRHVSLYWEASSDTQVTDYQIWRASDDHSFAKIATVKGRETTEFKDSIKMNLIQEVSGYSIDGKVFHYKIKGVNLAGAVSADSKMVSAKTKSPPSTPKILRVQNGPGTGFKVIWHPISQKDILEYVIEKAKTGKSRYRKVVSIPAQPPQKPFTFIDQEVIWKTPPFYRVKAIDRDSLESEWSQAVCYKGN